MKTASFWHVPARVKFMLALFPMLPCVPGLTFLLAGWLRDPLWPAQDLTPAMQAEYQRAAAQANGLYTAGTWALEMGVACGLIVGWKIVRRGKVETAGDAAAEVRL